MVYNYDAKYNDSGYYPTDDYIIVDPPKNPDLKTPKASIFSSFWTSQKQQNNDDNKVETKQNDTNNNDSNIKENQLPNKPNSPTLTRSGVPSAVIFDTTRKTMTLDHHAHNKDDSDDDTVLNPILSPRH